MVKLVETNWELRPETIQGNGYLCDAFETNDNILCELHNGFRIEIF